MTQDFKKNFLIDFAFILILGGLIYFAFKFLLIYLFPFIIGLLITVLIQKPSKFISEKINLKKGLCATILVLITYALLLGIVFFFGYKIVDFISSIASRFPEIMKYFEDTLTNVSAKLSALTGGMPEAYKESFSGAFNSLLSTLASKATTFVSSFAASAAANTPGVLISIVVTIVASCYIAKDYDQVLDFIDGRISKKTQSLLTKIKLILINKVFKIIKGYLIIMFITFVELSIGLLLLKINNAILIALLIAILDLLPVLGTGTVLIPWGIINLILGNYFIGFALIILYVAILVIRNVIEPKIISKQVGLHPLITLLCIFIGLKLFGVLGMLILPVITIMLFDLYKDGEFDGLGLKKAQ